MPFIINTLILTVSRGAFLGFIAGGMAAGYFIPKGFRKRFVLLSVLALALVATLAHDQFTERMVRLYESLTSEEVEVDNSARSRMAIFNAGIQIGRDNLLGSGYRATRAMSAKYLPEQYQSSPGVGKSAHNTFAAVFAEHGVPGTILYLAMILWVLKFLFFPPAMPSGYSNKDRALAVGLGAALVSMYISGNFTNDLSTETQYWILALICAQWANSLAEDASQTDAEGVAEGTGTVAEPVTGTRMPPSNGLGI